MTCSPGLGPQGRREPTALQRQVKVIYIVEPFVPRLEDIFSSAFY